MPWKKQQLVICPLKVLVRAATYINSTDFCLTIILPPYHPRQPYVSLEFRHGVYHRAAMGKPTAPAIAP